MVRNLRLRKHPKISILKTFFISFKTIKMSICPILVIVKVWTRTRNNRVDSSGQHLSPFPRQGCLVPLTNTPSCISQKPSKIHETQLYIVIFRPISPLFPAFNFQFSGQSIMSVIRWDNAGENDAIRASFCYLLLKTPLPTTQLILKPVRPN